MPTWREWQDSPWGRLRYAVAEANLARHLPPTPLRVLDLAGGDGADAIRLAARGHHVTIVDHSPDMLTAARTRADEAALTTRITCVESDIHALPPSEHDVVLCHNVLPYVDEPRATLAAALTHLRPGGVLSVMAVNRHSAPLVAAIRHLDPEAALAALDEPRARTELFDRHITLHTAEEITETLTALGCPPPSHYGIRTTNDYITDNAKKSDPTFFAALERLELALADRHPYKHTARLFHLVTTKSHR